MPNTGQIQYDDQGRAFIDRTGDTTVPEFARKKTFISPVAMGQKGPADSGGVFHGRPTFNQDTGNFESGLDWGNILSMVVAGTLTAGVALTMMGGGAAAESALATTAATGQVPAEIAAGGAAAAGGGAGAGGAAVGGAAGATGATAAAVPTVAGTAGGAGGAGGLTAGGVVKGAMTGYGTLSKLSKLAGAGANAEAAARRYDANNQAKMDDSNNSAQLNAAKFNLGAPDQLLNRLARVGVGLNAKDMGPTGDARIDKFAGGGLRPSLLQDPETQKGFKEAQRQSLLSLMNKDYQVNPTLSKIPEPGLMEKAGGAFATGMGMYDTAKDLWKDDTPTKLADLTGWEDFA